MLIVLLFVLNIPIYVYAMESGESSHTKRKFNTSNEEHVSKKVKLSDTLHSFLEILESNAIHQMEQLLASGFDVNQVYEDGHTPLTYALGSAKKDIINLLIAKGAKPCNTNNNTHINEFLEAAIKGDCKQITDFIAQGIDVNAVGDAGYTALICASCLDHTAIVEILLETHCIVDAQNIRGTTAFMFAAKIGHKEIAIKLLTAGANINHVNKCGYTALKLALAYNQKGIIQELVKPVYHDSISTIPLGAAVVAGNEELVEQLLELKADVNEKGPHNFTPLIYAARDGHLPMLIKLLKAGADSKATNNQGDTALGIALMSKHKEIVQELTKRRPELVNQETSGMTPILMQGNREMVTLLLEAGANVNKKAASECTPLEFAASRNYKDIVIKLIQAGAEGDKMKAIKSAFKASTMFGHIELTKILLNDIPDNQKTNIIKKAFKTGCYYGYYKLVAACLSLIKVQSILKLSNNAPLELKEENIAKTFLLANFLPSTKVNAYWLKESKRRLNEVYYLLGLYRDQQVKAYLKAPQKYVEKYIAKGKHWTLVNNQTVLMWASIFGHADIVKYLVTNNAFISTNEGKSTLRRLVNMKDTLGRTALMYAILYGHREIADFLLMYCNASINVQDKEGNTVLVYAVGEKDISLVSNLCKRNAEITPEAIQIAAERNDYRLATALLLASKRQKQNNELEYEPRENLFGIVS